MSALRRRIVLVAGIALVYPLLGLVAAQIASFNGVHPVFWLPAGLAVAAAWRYGYIAAVGVAASELLVGTWVLPVPSSTAIVHAIGNGLGTAALCWLFDRARTRQPFLDVEAMAWFLFAVPASFLVNAAFGAFGLYLGGVAPAEATPMIVWNWWCGDVCGALCLGPLLLAWQGRAELEPAVTAARRRRAWIAAAVAIAVVAALFLFSRAQLPQTMVFASMPPLLWIALRHGALAGSGALACAMLIAAAATARGLGPLSALGDVSALLQLQLWAAVLAFSMLLFSASAIERQRLVATLQDSAHVLEQRVQERTAELRAAHADTEAAHASLSTLSSIGRELTAQLDLDAVLEMLARQVGRVLQADTLSIGLYVRERDEIDMRIVERGGRREPAHAVPMQQRAHVGVWCVSHRLPILVGDAGQAGRDGEAVDGALLAVPIVLDGAAIGMISVHSGEPHAYQQTHLDALQTLAAYAAIAIANAHTHRELAATHANLVDTQRHLVMQEKMASLGGLVSGVAHEINTPLGVAITASTSLGDLTRDARAAFGAGILVQKRLEGYLGSAEQLTELLERSVRRAVDMVSTFKQVSIDRASDDRRRFALGEYLRGLARSLQPTWKQRPIAIAIDCSDLIELDSYPGALGQVVTSLVQNAVQHGFDERAQGRIDIAAKIVDRDVELVIADNGRGIPRDAMQHIFDPFFTTKREQGAIGLGLHIVWNLVTQKLGGRIHASSEPGNGTRFTVRVPIEAPQELRN